MKLIVVASHTDRESDPSVVVGEELALINLRERLNGILAVQGIDAEWEAVARQQVDDLVAEARHSLHNGESWGYGEDADGHGGTVAWGIVATPLPSSDDGICLGECGRSALLHRHDGDRIHAI